MPILKFFDNEIHFEGSPTLKELLLKEGLSDFLPCAKSGACAGCTFGACKRTLTDDTVIDGSIVIEASDGLCEGVAIDIGTTTVVCAGENGIRACLNPQTKIAPDVIGRIGYSVDGGKDTLQKLICDCLKSLGGYDGKKCVITGNTAMLYLLLGLDANDLAKSPFLAKNLFGRYYDNVYIPRCISAFVGADLTCAVLYSGMCDKGESCLLVDIGTNGEIALWHQGRLYVTACAAGPVFEGSGIECGMMAKDGVIDKVYAINGRLYSTTIGKKAPVGICGSGVIDAAASLIDIGEIHCKKYVIDGGVYITAEDIQKLMYAKAAIRAAIEVLLNIANITAEDVDTLYIAGGFGSHINLESAAKIGLFPKCLVKRSKVLGNAALSGAKLLLSDENIKKSKEIANSAICINLGGSEDFGQKYIENMYF